MRWLLTLGPLLRHAGTVLAFITALPVTAQTVERFDPQMEGLIAPNAKLKVVLRQKDGFFEGPAWLDSDGGKFVFADVPGNRLRQIDRRGAVTTLIDTMQKGSPPSTVIHDTLYTKRDLVGPNGTLPSATAVIVAMFGGNAIERFDLTSGSRTMLASGDATPAFRYANDLARGPRGDLYFSAHEGIFRLHEGTVTLFRAMAANGLAFSPDGHSLYATDGPTRIFRITIRDDGEAGPAVLLLDTHGNPAKGEFLDGMKVDRRGLLWAVAPGGIWIIRPDGVRIGRIVAPASQTVTGIHQRFTNLAFGGRDGRELLLTAPGGVYRMTLASPAALPSGR